jgi:hypothetical protein
MTVRFGKPELDRSKIRDDVMRNSLLRHVGDCVLRNSVERNTELRHSVSGARAPGYEHHLTVVNRNVENID